MTLNEKAALPLVYDMPKNVLEAKFSLHFSALEHASSITAWLRPLRPSRR